MDIFQKMLAGGLIDTTTEEFSKVFAIVNKTIAESVLLNGSSNTNEIRERLSVIIGKTIDGTTVIFSPFHTNFGKHISIGKNVFINHGCSFLDLGGITIEDNVLIGPKVNLITENHPTDPTQRKSLLLSSIHIRSNAWIGAGATILPGVTIGENAIVAAGAVVNKDIPANTVAGGVPAKFIKTI